MPRKAARWIMRAILCLLFLWPVTARGSADAPAVFVNDARPSVQVAARAEYLLDASGTVRYEDIADNRLPFQRHTRDSFQFSFNKAALWIKCRIAPADPEEAGAVRSRRSLLVLDNAALGSVMLWVPVIKDGANDVMVLSGGWQHGVQNQTYPFLYPTFVLPDSIDASRPVLIRVATPFSLQFRATLYTFDDFQKNSVILFLIVGFCAGILIAMLIYNFVLYLFIHDRRYLYYILYVFFLLLWQCTLFGLFPYFHVSISKWLLQYINVLALSMMFFAIVFAIVYLKTKKTAPRHDVILKAMAAGTVILIPIAAIQQSMTTTLLTYLMAQLNIVVVFTSAVSALRSGFKPARYYLIAVGVLLIAATIFLLKYYGLVPNNPFTMHIVLFGSTVESILLSSALGYHIRVMREEEQALREREKNLQAISVTDELTGLFNRRFLNAALIKEVAAARRSSAPLCLVMMDVDYFKDFNDTYGHLEGDQVLVVLGRLLTQVLREEDIACRYGGEEFATILHNADIKAALEAAERIRSRFEATPFQPGGGKTVCMTISIGVAVLLPDENPEQLLWRADQALYQAKQSGRNRICSA